jgi:hypothetical protein
MKIGKPRRRVTVEPVRDPVPKPETVPTPAAPTKVVAPSR